MTPKASDFIGDKISLLMAEGKPQRQAIAIAYSMARARGFKVPESNPHPKKKRKVMATRKAKKTKGTYKAASRKSSIARYKKRKARLRSAMRELREALRANELSIALVASRTVSDIIYNMKAHRVTHFNSHEERLK